MFADGGSPDHVGRVHATHVALLERDGDGEALRAALQQALELEFEQLEEASDFAARPILTRLAILARIAIRAGASELADTAIATVRKRLPDNGFPVDQAWLELLEAEIQLDKGETASALELTQRSITHAELFQAHETLARVYQALGNTEGRTAALTWIREHRGRAFVEDFDWFYGQAFNVLDWSRANRALATKP
jgi:hypothetical protein